MVYDDPCSKGNLFIGTEYQFKCCADIDLFLDETNSSENLLEELLPEQKGSPLNKTVTPIMINNINDEK